MPLRHSGFFRAIMPLLVFCLCAGPAAASAVDLNERLHRQLAPVQAGFIGHEAVTVSERSLREKYLILDFRLHGDLHENPGERLQSRIHAICTTVLSNRDLIRDLSSKGYSKVAVAFDKRSQYDCL